MNILIKELLSLQSNILRHSDQNLYVIKQTDEIFEQSRNHGHSMLLIYFHSHPISFTISVYHLIKCHYSYLKLIQLVVQIDDFVNTIFVSKLFLIVTISVYVLSSSSSQRHIQRQRNTITRSISPKMEPMTMPAISSPCKPKKEKKESCKISTEFTYQRSDRGPLTFPTAIMIPRRFHWDRLRYDITSLEMPSKAIYDHLTQVSIIFND